jgi:hypothetical protein
MTNLAVFSLDLCWAEGSYLPEVVAAPSPLVVAEADEILGQSLQYLEEASPSEAVESFLLMAEVWVVLS